MNTEQKIIELEKRVATLEEFYTLFRTSFRTSTPAGQGTEVPGQSQGPEVPGQSQRLEEALKKLVKQPAGQGPPIESHPATNSNTAGQQYQGGPNWTPATNSDPAGQ